MFIMPMKLIDISKKNQKYYRKTIILIFYLRFCSMISELLENESNLQERLYCAITTVYNDIIHERTKVGE